MVFIYGPMRPTGIGRRAFPVTKAIAFEGAAVDFIVITNIHSVSDTVIGIVRGDLAVGDVAGDLGKALRAELIDKPVAEEPVEKQRDCRPKQSEKDYREPLLCHADSLGEIRELDIANWD